MMGHYSPEQGTRILLHVEVSGKQGQPISPSLSHWNCHVLLLGWLGVEPCRWKETAQESHGSLLLGALCLQRPGQEHPQRLGYSNRKSRGGLQQVGEANLQKATCFQRGGEQARWSKWWGNDVRCGLVSTAPFHSMRHAGHLPPEPRMGLFLLPLAVHPCLVLKSLTGKHGH